MISLPMARAKLSRRMESAIPIGYARCQLRIIAARRGAYVAVLEGDDYWTSPEKLQVQADLLDQNPAIAVCGHQVTFLYEGQDRPPEIGPDVQDGLYGIEELLRWNFLPTCTAMYRWNLIGTLPEWYFQLKIGDWPMHILFAQHGKTAFLRQPMGVTVCMPREPGRAAGKLTVSRSGFAC